MKCIAAIEVDLNESPIGTKSRADREMHGKPVLTRTIEQMCKSKRIDHLFVLCPSNQSERCTRLVPDELSRRVTVRVRRIDAQPYRALIRTARKWSLDAWRGGIGGTCSMDEYTRSDELALLAHDESAEALLCASACAPLIDPVLIDTMIDHSERTTDEARITFAQAPPGLVGTVYQTDFLMEIGAQHVPPGMVLSYKPDHPMMDLAHKSCCYTAPAAVRHAGGRLIVDTDRAFETVGAYLSTGMPIEAETVGRWLIEKADAEIPDLPREVEIELTTEDQLPGTVLRPRGPAVGRRGPIDINIVAKIARELGAVDDSLVLLGGFGEPLLHPEFDEILSVLREHGVYGIAVRSNCLALSDERIDALVSNKVDLLAAALDAWTPELYRTVHGEDRLEEAVANVRHLAARRAESGFVAPLVVPEMTKSVDTLDEMDAFFDGWVRETGWANFVGYNHYSNRRDDRCVIEMAPPTRRACRRIGTRATVLADGRMIVCDQDYEGRHAAGTLAKATLREIWHSEAMDKVRRRHRGGEYDALSICGKCAEWHRP